MMRNPREVQANRALPPAVCVVGPTSSGKTKLAVRLAHRFNGEVINADARQLFQGLTIGTGKPAGERVQRNGLRAYWVDGIPHHLMDVLAPSESLTVAEWKDRAIRIVRAIRRRKHLPIITGGTGLYIKSIVDNLQFPKVEPKPHLRQAFAEKPLHELVNLLLTIDPVAATAVDLKNPRRVIRAIEVTTFTGRPFTEQRKEGKPLVEALQVGIQWPRDELNRRIDREVDWMIAHGWVDEIRALMAQGITADAPAMTSIGYRELMRHVNGEMGLEDAITACKTAVHRYAKRQETWFRRDSRIQWFPNEDEAVAAVEAWVRARAENVPAVQTDAQEDGMEKDDLVPV